VNDSFALIWNAANEDTRVWIAQGLLARNFENNDQNRARWRMMLRSVGDRVDTRYIGTVPAPPPYNPDEPPLYEGQDATNPYMVSFVSTARPPRPVLASNAMPFVF